MEASPVLFVGGSGVVGRSAAAWFRQRYPQVPLLIGGRDPDRARAAAAEVTAAEAVIVDFDSNRIDYDGPIGAVVSFAPDHLLNGLRFAQHRGIPYATVTPWLAEVGAEFAAFALRPEIPLLVGSHWWGGTAVALVLSAAQGLDTVERVRVGVVLDSDDETGPATVDDLQRGGDSSAILAIVDGRREWLSADAAQAEVVAADGRVLSATAMAPIDVASVLASTGARNIRFDLAVDVSSSRRRGGPIAAELVVEVEGTSDGVARHARSSLEFAGGQASLTGLATAISLGPFLGIGDHKLSPHELNLPEQLTEHTDFLDQLRAEGALITNS